MLFFYIVNRIIIENYKYGTRGEDIFHIKGRTIYDLIL